MVVRLLLDPLNTGENLADRRLLLYPQSTPERHSEHLDGVLPVPVPYLLQATG